MLQRTDASSSSKTITREALFKCGVVSALTYAISHDVLALLLYDGYSAFSQAVSELSSVGAPTRPWVLVAEFISDAFLVAFGIGVWQSAQRSRALRVVGISLIGYGALFPLWLPFPMTARGGDAAPGLTDLMHVTLGAITIVLMLTAIGFGALALGPMFKIYSIATFFAVLVFWTWSATFSSAVADQEPTPWFGVVERVALGVWLAWVSVLAVALLRRLRSLKSAQLLRA
jgi:hypothetical protein